METIPLPTPLGMKLIRTELRVFRLRKVTYSTTKDMMSGVWIQLIQKNPLQRTPERKS